MLQQSHATSEKWKTFVCVLRMCAHSQNGYSIQIWWTIYIQSSIYFIITLLTCTPLHLNDCKCYNFQIPKWRPSLIAHLHYIYPYLICTWLCRNPLVSILLRNNQVPVISTQYFKIVLLFKIVEKLTSFFWTGLINAHESGCFITSESSSCRAALCNGKSSRVSSRRWLLRLLITSSSSSSSESRK